MNNEQECPECESTRTFPAWETPERFKEKLPPDYLGCLDCVELFRQELTDGFGFGVRVTDIKRSDTDD